MIAFCLRACISESVQSVRVKRTSKSIISLASSEERTSTPALFETSVVNYKFRWQIESLFKALKTSGFNLEDTHLRHIDRFAVVSLAFVWALKTDHRPNGLKPILRKSHGRRAVSVFRLGLDHLRHSIAMFGLDYKLLDNAFRFLSCT